MRFLTWLLLAAQVLSLGVPAYASDEHGGRLQWVCCCLDADGDCPSENGGPLRACCVPVITAAGAATADLISPSDAVLADIDRDDIAVDWVIDRMRNCAAAGATANPAHALEVSARQHDLYLTTLRLRL